MSFNEAISMTSVQDAFLGGVRQRIRESLDQYTKELLAQMHKKIETELENIAKEAAEAVATQLVSSFQIADPRTKLEVLIEILKPVIKEKPKGEK